ncbi:collagen-like protein [Bacillus cereus]|uniref:collagen-like protein n=1 Tax=Bacillus cereus TaxID=1396 RepID=UPI0035CAFF41
MSQANIPNVTPIITIGLDEAIKLLLVSVAIEELGVSHIINAEAEEKLQYTLGTLLGLSTPATINDVLAINSSIKDTLVESIKLEMTLEKKLETILNTPLKGATGKKGLTGVTGATGATGQTGVTGVQVTFNNAFFRTQPAISVPSGAPIPLAENYTLNGGAITHTAGSPDIFLAPNQTYYITYRTKDELLGPGSITGHVQLQLNGVPIPGTDSLMQSLPGAPQAITSLLSNTIYY